MYKTKMNPQQYFTTLANNNVNKYNELITFSKEFITESLTKDVTWLFGHGNNGKTTFMKLLCSLVDKNKINYGVEYKYSVDAFNETLRYCIIEEHEGPNTMDKINQLLKEIMESDNVLVYADDNLSKFVKPNIKFIVLSNCDFYPSNPSTTSNLMSKTQLIEMSKRFDSNSNILNELLENKQAFRDFILAH